MNITHLHSLTYLVLIAIIYIFIYYSSLIHIFIINFYKYIQMNKMFKIIPECVKEKLSF